VSGDLVLLRTAKGRIHRGFELDGRRLTDEACQLDDAPGAETPITFADLEAAAEADLCQRCFPREPEPA
jgi:hypothetical protein